MKMGASKIFISHSSRDKKFANLVVSALEGANVSPWIDSEKIITGDDIFDRLGEGLQLMDMLIFLASKNSLNSEWVSRELKFAITREIIEKQILVLSFVIDDTPIDSLPWFIQQRNVTRVTPDADGAAKIAINTRLALKRRWDNIRETRKNLKFIRDPQIDELISDVSIGDWDAAAIAAIKILKATGKNGRNILFESLLEYQDYPGDDDMLWSAMLVIESCAQLSPSLITHEILSRMAEHDNFTVRSSAASICMEFAQFAPDRVPVDILLNLSKYDEDWYVQSPANAAPKSIASSQPAILHIFYQRLLSDDPDERAHAAYALAEIAHREPEILNLSLLKHAHVQLVKLGDKEARHHIETALPLVQNAQEMFRYKYGL
jgi:hypothetical protein